jgi:hypothetical protein
LIITVIVLDNAGPLPFGAIGDAEQQHAGPRGRLGRSRLRIGGRLGMAHLDAPAFLSAPPRQEEDGQNDCPNDAPAKPSDIWVSRLPFEDFLVDRHEYDFRLSLLTILKRFMPIQLDPDQGETFSSL